MDNKNYLLAIAIDDYEHYGNLNNAKKDVQEVIDILTTLYQFEKNDIHTLFDKEATEDGIDEKFLELIDLVTEDDNIIIFYSGHGYYRENVNEGYWIPVDGRKDKISDFIGNAALIKYLQNIKAHHILMIIDSCFSGTLVEQLRGDSNSEKFPSRRVFASGREEVIDGAIGENSPFAKGMIDFLKANVNQAASTTSMIDSVRQYVENYTDGEQNPIEGRLRNSKDNRGEFFFKRKLTENDFWIKALDKDDLEAYQEYLTIYPNGNYSGEANHRFKVHFYRRKWNETLRNDTLDDYLDYITLYPESEYIEQARAKKEIKEKAVEEQRKIELERKERLKTLAAKEKEIERCRKEYKRLARESYEDILNGEYRPARRKLRECEELFYENKEGFIPSIREIQQKIKLCSDKLNFFEFKEDGELAFGIRDYISAERLFNEALVIEPSNENLIKLRDAAIQLNNVDTKIDVKIGSGKRETSRNTKGNRSIVIGKAKRLNKKKQIIVKKKPVPIRNSSRPIKFNRKQSTSDKKPNEKDLTFLWIGLLILGYFLLVKILGIF